MSDASTLHLEEAAATLVLADATDLPQLAQIHGKLEEVAADARAEAANQCAHAAEAAAALVQNIILSEVDDPAAALQMVSSTITSLQQVLRDGRQEADVHFDILNPAPAPAGPAPSANGEAATEPAEDTGAGQPLEGDPDLLGEFITESTEHLDQADVQLLTLETEPTDSDALNALFRAFHTIKGVAGFLALGDVQALAHEAEFLLDSARKDELRLEGPAIDVTFEAVDMLKQMVSEVRVALESDGLLQRPEGTTGLIERIKAAREGRAAVAPDDQPLEVVKPLGEIVSSNEIAPTEVVDAALAAQRESGVSPETGESAKLGELLVRSGVPAKDVGKALGSQQRARQAAASFAREPVKVDADRLDALLDLIGELVIAESMVSQSEEVRQGASTDLNRQLTQLDKITRELQEMATGLRMVPIRPTFQKMARLVRDLAKKSGKQVNFEMRGEDTELDKSVIDKIGDPLVHMVRNAVDHGLEPDSDTREAAGKAPAGTITLSAYHAGGNIVIEISDDGRGLNREVILRKAHERGLVRDGEHLSDRDVFNLIFEPGFSTAAQITEVSGRGVGMDVVRRNIEYLRGSVEISSSPGKGSTFVIRLPLTLAIIDGMVVRVGDERYIIPTLSILVSLQPQPQDVQTVVGKGEAIMLHGELVPLVRLHQLYHVQPRTYDPTEAIVMVVENEGRRVGLLLDEIVGQQQIVIKSLGPALSQAPGIAGGAIMPDGKVGLILDIGGLAKLGSQLKELGTPARAGNGQHVATEAEAAAHTATT